MSKKSIINTEKYKVALLALIDYIFFSLSNVFMKLSSSHDMILDKIIWYSCSMICLFVFSIMWQILLKKLPLNKAYLFKGTTLFWGLIFGVLIFNEKITVNMLIGVLIVLIGVFVTFTGGEKNE